MEAAAFMLHSIDGHVWCKAQSRDSVYVRSQPRRFPIEIPVNFAVCNKREVRGKLNHRFGINDLQRRIALGGRITESADRHEQASSTCDFETIEAMAYRSDPNRILPVVVQFEIRSRPRAEKWSSP
jgi:hypothetical protein